MADDIYDVYFSGQLIADADLAQVQRQVGRLFGIEGAALEQLFSGNPIRVKASVDQETAIKYRVAFRDAGALVEIRPAKAEQGVAPSAPPAGESAPSDTAGMSLLPPNTGSLIDCAPEVAAAEIPDTSGVILAPPGETLDTTEPVPPARIDTSSLTMTPANSGSLEDCQPPVEPAEIPDISALRLTD